MKVSVVLEWFLNPDHLPLIKAQELLKEKNITLQIIEPDEHYDGFEALMTGDIEFAVNEPLHLIEQFSDNILSLGLYFQTKGGVLLTPHALNKLKNKETIRISTPVSNVKTDTIGYEFIKRYAHSQGIHVMQRQVIFEATDFYHIQNIKKGFDGAWLYFYNFEAVEAKYENIELIFIDTTSVDIANFCALDIYTNKAFYAQHRDVVLAVIEAVQHAATTLINEPEMAKTLYYTYSKTQKSPRMDEIIEETLQCFHPQFGSCAEKQTDILNFFQEIGLTTLQHERFKGAFLHS